MPMSARHAAAYVALHAHALRLPTAYEEFPWGHSAIKVKGKVFAFLHNSDMEGAVDAVSISLKLPLSAGHALHLPFASPTGYGLGKANWVSFKFSDNDDVPVDILTPWIDESFRAVAPKRVLAQLDAGPSSTTATTTTKPATTKPATTKPAMTKPAAKKPAPKKPAAKTTATKKPATKKTPTTK
ncbi:MAG TPA: MmcQ/YjbR family DNA-binding protein, partial [Myxococcota bacterium]